MQSDGTLQISVKKEFPITIENENFKFVLAPRVSSD